MDVRQLVKMTENKDLKILEKLKICIMNSDELDTLLDLHEEVRQISHKNVKLHTLFTFASILSSKEVPRYLQYYTENVP